MSTTTTGAASAASTDSAVPTAEGFWKHLYHEVSGLWFKVVQQGEDASTFVSNHPEIAGPVQSLEAQFPPQVREGINVAEEFAMALRGMNAHVVVATSVGSGSVGSAAGAGTSPGAPTPAASSLSGSGSASSGSGA